MTTNDHTVPQMYLRRFAEQRRNRGHFTVARPVEDPTKSFESNVRNVGAVKGFHWAVDDRGREHHDAEKLFTRIETAATPVFSTLLDDADHALPHRPLSRSDRRRLSWWIAAQLLRTTRQRKRFAHLAAAADGAALPASAGVRSFAANNPHLQFVGELLEPVARMVHDRPWGFGFSDVCLLTGDVPAVILNGHDHRDQIASAAHWDILLPLDPHRFLFLPGPGMLDDPAKRLDHRLHLPGCMSLFLSDAIFEAADRQIFRHPHHDPLRHKQLELAARLPTPWTDGRDREGPGYVLEYPVMPRGFTIERRWTREHPPDRE
ncbi:DUF4238 domain-containing protein [Embleya sp. NPDC050493]|uniref:DUF4238 domain-containing protein n=1 Tax=Embleya sp. NPDC050493 TaxID=3363989 RepID=UPI0037BB7B28